MLGAGLGLAALVALMIGLAFAVDFGGPSGGGGDPGSL
jgi:hypothetical protein